MENDTFSFWIMEWLVGLQPVPINWSKICRLVKQIPKCLVPLYCCRSNSSSSNASLFGPSVIYSTFCLFISLPEDNQYLQTQIYSQASLESNIFFYLGSQPIARGNFALISIEGNRHNQCRNVNFFDKAYKCWYSARWLPLLSSEPVMFLYGFFFCTELFLSVTLSL